MKKLPIQLKRIIKKKRFSLNTLDSTRSWRGGLDIDYRITMVKAEQEDEYCHLTPCNNNWGRIFVNIKVKGQVEKKPSYGAEKVLVEIAKATRTKKNYWGGYDSKYDSLWGNQVNKTIRTEIRNEAVAEVKNFLKLMGIQSEYTYDGIKVQKISWDK